MRSNVRSGISAAFVRRFENWISKAQKLVEQTFEFENKFVCDYMNNTMNKTDRFTLLSERGFNE